LRLGFFFCGFGFEVAVEVIVVHRGYGDEAGEDSGGDASSRLSLPIVAV
jgi:hypothetical protein